MIEKERNHIIKLLRKAQKALQNNDNLLLKKLSNQTIHTASIYKDIDSIVVAVTVYALSKIIEREKYRDYKEWSVFFNLSVKNLGLASKHLKKNEVKQFRNSLVEIRKAADNFSSNLKHYIKQVFDRAAIKKASRLYEHGLSLSETTELLGITQWELSEYVGKTGIGDVDLSITKNVKERINFTKKLFGK
jgi:hypothetical protein